MEYGFIIKYEIYPLSIRNNRISFEPLNSVLISYERKEILNINRQKLNCVDFLQ